MVIGETPTATDIRLIGALRATVAGRRVDQELPGRKGRLLFAFLVLNRHRSVSRRELTDVLWHEGVPASPDSALSTVLSRVRHAIGEHLVQGRAELTLVLPEDARIDLEQATERVTAASDALAAGDAASALAAAQSAVAVMDGPLLPEFADGWVEARRRELEDALASALETYARSALALGPAEATTARSAARRMIELEPWRESGYALLMEAHAQAGDVAEGLRVFERLRTLLRDELGVHPSAALLALHQKLLSGDISVSLTAPVASALVERVPVRVTLPPVLARLGRRPFVGRGKELDMLSALWAGGDDALVLLSGEPGVGKTALAARFAQQVHADGATALFGQCDEHSVVPYQPFAEALRHFCRDAGPAWVRQAPIDVAELGRIIPELPATASENQPAASVDPGFERFRLFEAVRSLLALVAEDHPLVLVLDDGHWAENSTVLMLSHVIREPFRSRFMVVVTCRDTELGHEHPLQEALTDLAGARRVERVALQGFDVDDSAELINAYAAAPLRPEVVQRWQERTDGHPLFLHELLRSVDRTLVGAASDVDIPVTVKDVIARRVARLEPDSAAALATAAVIGREFDLDVLTAMIGDSTENTIRALEDAMARALIDEVPDRFDRFSFTHALIHEVLYEQHSRTRRTRLHLQVGQLLERAGSRASPADLAHHFFIAHHIAGADQAVRYCVKAAKAAAHALAYEEAAQYYRRALEALEDAGPHAERERCELLIGMGEVQWRAGDPSVDRTFTCAAENALARGDAQQLARAALGGRNHERGVADPPRVALLEDALRALGRQDHPVLRIRVLSRLAEALHFSGACARAQDLSAEAMTLASELGDPEALAAALMGRHAAMMHVEHVGERVPLLRELIVLASQLGRLDLAAHGHQWTTYALLELGDLDAARLAHDTFSGVAKDLNEPGYAHVAMAWAALFAQLDGDLDTAERLAIEGHALADRVRGIDAVALLGAQLFFIRREQGRLSELVEAVQAFVDANELPAWRAGLAIALASAGEWERARRSFDIAMTGNLAKLPRDMWWLATVTLLAEGCADLGDCAAARQLYEVLRPYAERSVQVAFAAHLGSVHRPLALLAATQGQSDAARVHFEAALRRHEGSRALMNRTRREFADMLVVTGRRDDARRAERLLAGVGVGGADRAPST